MTIYYYDDNEKCHVEHLKVRNPVSALFEPKIAKRFAEDFAKAMGLEIIEEDDEILKNK